MMCLSADGTVPNTAVLWACIPYLEMNMVVSVLGARSATPI